jgi:hypothetical protein
VKSERNLGAAMPVSFWGGVGHGSFALGEYVEHRIKCAFILCAMSEPGVSLVRRNGVE